MKKFLSAVMKTPLLFISFPFCCFSLFAQTRNPALDIMRTNIWRFGFTNFTTGINPPGLDFSSGSPIVFNCGNKPVGEGATTISDTAGNMLLSGGYGGVTPRMFDRTCDIMSNSGIVGDIGFVGSSRANIAIPQPLSPNLIYYFSSAMTFNYLVVDMNLDGGLGAVILRDTLELGPTGVKLSAVHHCNGSDVWVVGHRWETDTFFAYLLTDTGITLPPVYTKIGPVDNSQGRFQSGRMKFSHDGNKLLIIFSNSIVPHLFDFDKSTGIISTPLQLQNDGAGAMEFSPDNSKLYISDGGGRLVQYNLKAGSDSAIVQSRKIVAPHLPFHAWQAMQLGRDGKIYLSPPSQPQSYYLDVINNPNALDTLCDLQIEAIYLNGSTGYGQNSLMSTVNSYFYTGSSAYPCYGDTTPIGIAASGTNLGIRVYPNPFSDYATIDIPNVLFTKGKIEYRLFDMVGREYKARIMQRNYGIAQLHRGELKPGIYALVINLYGNTQTFKISIL